MFTLNRNTVFVSDIAEKPVQNAVALLERDRDKVFVETEKPGGCVMLVKKSMARTFSEEDEEDTGWQKERVLVEERYKISVCSDKIVIYAQGELGFVYGLLYISEKYMGIQPFWFWMDQNIETKKKVLVPEGVICSEDPAVVFRGWFFNDEVLMLRWKYNENGMDGWKMCFEALLRCGGNMAIPGTDKESRKNRSLAAEYGLWLTHHHAEPLGAEMFARAYPGESPNYFECQEKFQALWKDAVEEQKGYKVVWNVCFRGQGDAPFWSYDTTGQFDTPQKRGKMISDMIKQQCDLVREQVEQPIFCTNLYGEIMELYEQGLVELSEDIIKVRADNGFGKMVTRRRDSHPGRVNAMPDAQEKSAQGIYYHVSFYDLQAANHITMLPNSVDFVNRELDEVIANKGDFFWVINCSNVRPHTYFLDVVRKKWFGGEVIEEDHAEKFVDTYFTECEEAKEEIVALYLDYPKVMLSYGPNEDEHAGEQFYTENVRILCHQLLTDKKNSARGLRWLTGDVGLTNQVQKFQEICRQKKEELEKLCLACTVTENGLQQKNLLSATIGLHIKIHQTCRRGARCFARGYEALMEKDYEKAFLLFGDSAVWFDKGDALLRGAEYGVWKDFYKNDCFADIKHTAYMVRKVMGLVRELGDNARHDNWQRKFCYAPEDRDVYLLLLTDNHMTDQELYEEMKKRVLR